MDLYADLSNAEMDTVLDGGSARRVIRPKSRPYAEWMLAWIDLDGLWLDDRDGPGYVDPARWEIDRP